MTKKSFRTQAASGPRYPRLSDLRPGSLRRWGLAAIGSLLLGGAGCRRTAGEVAARGSVKTDAAPVHAPQTSREAASGAGAPDGGARKGPVQLGGKRPAPRFRADGGKPVKLKTRKDSSPQKARHKQSGKRDIDED